jgi:hypothetical protein
MYIQFSDKILHMYNFSDKFLRMYNYVGTYEQFPDKILH